MTETAQVDTPVATEVSSQTLFEGSHGTGALYVDGSLVLVADRVEVYRRSLEIAGVQVTESDDFLRGQRVERDDFARVAAPSLVAIQEFADIHYRAEALRQQAASLEAEAAALDALIANTFDPAPVLDGEPGEHA